MSNYLPEWMNELKTYFKMLTLMAEGAKEYNGCKVIVEIGVLKGNGGEALLNGCPNAYYYGYDKLIRPEAKERIERFKNAKLIKVNSFEVKKLPELTKKADLIYVDAGHTCGACLNDMDLAFEHISDKGIILVHDHCSRDVTDGMDKWHKNHKDFKRMKIPICKGWGVFWR